MEEVISFDDLLPLASQLGLNILSSVSIEEYSSKISKSLEYLKIWQEQGFAADMDYMKRELLFHTDLSNIIKDAKSIITFVVPYSVDNNYEYPEKNGFGRVARYAWGLDYHQVLRSKLNQFVDLCRTNGLYKGNYVRCFSDSVPILERSLADISLLGFIGKSSMLIKPGIGTYFFICEIVWDVEVTKSVNNKSNNIKSKCGTCVQCKNACPTSAIINDKVIDANKCISYLTIEKRTEFKESEIKAIGSWIFGCDICQEVCPYNNRNVQNDVFQEFHQEKGVGPYLSLSKVLKIKSDQEFNKLFKTTALLRTKRIGLIRNALSIVANQKNFDLLEDVGFVYKNDQSEMLKNQAKLTLEILLGDSSGKDKKFIEAIL